MQCFVYDPVCSVAGVQFSNSCEAECAGLTPADFSRRMLPTDYTPGPCTASATGLGGANPNLSDPGRRHLRENAALLSDAELAALLGISGFASQPVDTVTPLSPSPISSIGAGSGAGLVASPVVGTSPPADAAPLPAAPALGGYTAQRNLAGAYAYGYGGSAAPSPVGAYNAKQCNCAFIFAPVCASSGVQYANACTALCDGLQPSDWSEGPCAKASVSPTQTITGASRKAGQQVPGRRLLQKTTAAKPAAAKNNTAVPNVDPVLGVSVLIPANNTAIAFSPSSGISIQTAPVDDGGFVSAPKRNASGPSRAPSIAPAPAKVAPAIIPSFQAAARSASAPAPAPALAIMSQQPIDLGTASAFVVLGAATVTNTGPSAITGDLGVSPGTAITGLPPGIMTNGTIQAGSGKAAAAHADATSAYNQAAGRTVGSASVSGNLGGMTLPPGLYTSTAGFAVSSGDLTLDGQGSTSSVFVFQMATTLVMSAGRRIVLTNGASAQNIFWQVGSSATFGVGSVAVGNVLAYASITMTTGARVTGRLLALTGAVTLDSNTVVKPAAVPVAPAAAPAPTKVGGASTESFPGAAAIPVPIPSTPFITPLGVVGGPGGYGGFQSPSLPGRYGSPSLGSYGGSGSYAPAPVPGYGYGGGYGLGAYGSGYYLSSEYLDMLRRRRQPTPAPAPAPAADPPKLFAPGPVPAVAGFGANAAAVVSGQMLICAAQPTVDYINAPVINAADLEFAIQAHFVETAANALAVGASDIRAAQFRKEGVSGCLVPPTNFGGFEFPTEPQACCCASPDSVFVKPFEVVAGSAQEANTMVTTLGLASLSGTFADSFSQFDQLDGRVCASLLAPPSVTLNPGANGRKLFADDAAVVPQRGRWAHSSLGRRLKDV
ncbi:hypothetical protein WJX72_000306 [[Myrmecia] bisecta]|uniref:Kazal-like domain-containing protein n=1 Tax=[Myrmecia] bisecta TaxID=41462 RepID=A0AAW1PJ98_9CHLO